MEKQVMTFNVDYVLDWTYSVSLSKIREDLDALEKLGATHVEIEAYTNYDCAYVDITPKAERIETDEEYNERVKASKKFHEENTRRELEQLARLKAKYEK